MIKKIFQFLTWQKIILFCIFFSTVFAGINFYVYYRTKDFITHDSTHLKSMYTVIVPGAKAYSLDSLSPVLEDRISKALFLYKKNIVKRFLLSGDHGKKEYDEVNAMKIYLLKKGVNSDDIFLDHAGFNTYDSLYRAKYIFEVDNAIIVSQGYHLYRCVYIARELKINAYGYRANQRKYIHIQKYKYRELLAIVKSFLETFIHRKPRFLGKKIPITGNSKHSWD